jgi:arginine/lysine/ornithine decarboxylase
MVMNAAIPIRARTRRSIQTLLPGKCSQEAINQDKTSQTINAKAAIPCFKLLFTATPYGVVIEAVECKPDAPDIKVILKPTNNNRARRRNPTAPKARRRTQGS